MGHPGELKEGRGHRRVEFRVHRQKMFITGDPWYIVHLGCLEGTWTSRRGPSLGWGATVQVQAGAPLIGTKAKLGS
jgi:hypothetical protein